MTIPQGDARPENALRFVFPMPPNLANSRMHWRVKHRAKKEYWALCDNQPHFIPRAPEKPIEFASITAKVFGWAKSDMGNLMNRMKWIEDWLTTRGYIVDDSEKRLKWTAFPEQHIDRKFQRIEITLETQE